MFTVAEPSPSNPSYRQGLTLVGVGAVLGLRGTFSVSQSIASILYGSARDAASFPGVAAALLLVATIASLIPARRASRVNPMIALRD